MNETSKDGISAGAGLYDDALARLDRSAALADADEETVLRLRTPEHIVQVSIPVCMDDGSMQIFQGMRVRHSTLRGPGKGGIRYRPDVNLDEVRARANSAQCTS